MYKILKLKNVEIFLVFYDFKKPKKTCFLTNIKR